MCVTVLVVSVGLTLIPSPGEQSVGEFSCETHRTVSDTVEQITQLFITNSF